ncbi:MAG: hypothetical protein K0R59_2085 [Sphingobacterium sp.]|jgi:energy-converting hydrogenase Eha subunit G|nr:hypothetical protein [Sphingobacterium sp.]
MSTCGIAYYFFVNRKLPHIKQVEYQHIAKKYNVSITLQIAGYLNFWHKIKACILRLWIRNIFITKGSLFESAKK